MGASRNGSKGGRLVGYARVSTMEQETESQLDELRAIGCNPIHEEHGSGADRDRPVLSRLLLEIGRGDTLVVVRIDRLARSVSHLLQVIEDLQEKGAYFRSLRDPIDTTTPQGMFSLQVLGAVAQLERALISERTKAGLQAARAKGRIGGNPGLRAGNPEAIRVTRSARNKVHMEKILAKVDGWLPIVRQYRPSKPWGDVARLLKASGQSQWTAERLRRTVRRLVSEGIVDRSLLNRAPRQNIEGRLMAVVTAIAGSMPGPTVERIASRLESMQERSPLGATRWHHSSVRSMLRRAGRLEHGKGK